MADWADAAVNEIVRDLSDRRGIKWAWEEIDEDIQAEIRKTWSDILRQLGGQFDLQKAWDEGYRAGIIYTGEHYTSSLNPYK